ncbi:MAG: thiol-disulfide oxidoreductase DCC family protein [Bacteroidetes bacterium]|nr:thiol-disulfide oxidoreductase DCC family protein [Bacteroidota bacterium]
MEKSIVLFDGVCNLCNGSVNFIIDHDPKAKFQFAALQSEVAEKLLIKFGLDPKEMDSIKLVEGDKYYTKSTAALRIARHLNKGWSLFYVFIIVPPFIRNWVYDFIAANRYKWFGKRDACRMPDANLKERFL